MEESSLPKRNIILAAILAFGFYWAWSLFLPKLHPPRSPQNNNKPPSPDSPVIAGPAPSIPKAQVVEFESWGGKGKILLGQEGSLEQLSYGVNGNEFALLPETSFLKTTPVEIFEESWALKNLAADGVRLELKTRRGTYQKEFIWKNQEPGFALMRLTFLSSGKEPGIVALAIHPKLSSGQSGGNQPSLFAGYAGKKSLIVSFPKKKETSIAVNFEGQRPLVALGLSGQYHLAAITNMDHAYLTGSVEQSPDASGLLWTSAIEPNKTLEIPFYIGLKTQRAIDALGLQNLVYGGWLGPLKRLIRHSLNFFYKTTGNYGFAIILLTVAFQILLIPLTIKNLKFSQKMKDLAPKIQHLQQKFKHDPKKMNEETMLLYRSHGANPLGGCMVLILQMPIFFALYGALMDSYELYGAPFVLWIKNLATHDPTYILPLLMGAAMFVQTKKSQAVTTDPSQKMLTYTMPILFTFMFLKFPSGLVLYWLTSNLISLGLTMALPKFIDKIN
ncbi:MAG: membrane protein insertase YidC [Elusimicrobia bacterium]|nr:membrane protein insertase YidC [Elusimicrobiota bacterium]